MNLSAVEATTWPSVVLTLGLVALATFLLAIFLATMHEFRKTKLMAKQEDNLRQLVQRYERLAENTLDAQQRVAADVAELRVRTTSIEHILRTVE